MSQHHLINVYKAGEDLEEVEEEEDEEAIDEDRRAYDQPSGSQDPSLLHAGQEAAQGSLARILADSQPSKSAVSETSPLLPRSSSLQRSRTKRRRASVSHGDATVGQAVLMVCHGLSLYYVRGACPPLIVAFEIFCRDGGFIFGKSVSSTAVCTLVRCLIVRVSFFNGGLLFSSITLSAIALISLYSFLLLVKTKFVVSGSFGGMSLPAVITMPHF